MEIKDKALIKRQNIVNIMSQREEFIIIGLTGKIGSGCSESARIFGSSFKNLELPWIQPDTKGFEKNEDRDKRILERYASAHWLKFDVIKTRTIISTFLLGKNDIDKFTEFLEFIINHSDENNFNKKEIPYKIDNLKVYVIKEIIRRININKVEVKNNLFIDEKVEKEEINEVNRLLNKIYEYKTTNESSHDSFAEILKDHITICDILGAWYNKIDKEQCLDERSRVLTEIETCLFSVSASYAKIYLEAYKDDIFKHLRFLNDYLAKKNYDETHLTSGEAEVTNLLLFSFVNNMMPTLSDIIHELVDYSEISFTELFQKYGNSIRRYGDIFINDEAIIDQNSDIFSIPRKINQFIKVLRHPFSKGNCRPVRVVIDSIKNVFEATYLRQRYSAFYLFAISADEDVRKNRLMQSDGKNMTMRQINFADWNEYSSIGCEIYQDGNEKKLDKYNDDDDRKAFYEHIKNPSQNHVKDFVREEAYKINQQQYYLQDVASSIENADVFISNNHKGKRKNMKLKWEIVRNVCLIMFPGLLLPTPVERCMQVAFAAKCNSGCLSRQVGAVVTDKDYNILSIGWNDVPCGDMSCSRKNLVDLCKFEDQIAYTKYELENEAFRERLSKFNYHEDFGKLLKGLPMRYCFKDIHTDRKNPMRSRAMHAEEKALAICGENARGGYLFTTSSPCEMCSKNAKNHQIKKIYYIELYPGISEDQYSASGDINNIAEHVLFTGAIGRAYTQMYTPIMPQKDIIDFLGVGELCWNK